MTKASRPADLAPPIPPMSSHRLSIDVTSVAPAGAERCVAEVFVPDKIAEPTTVLWCVPGGGMSRRYFDLVPPAEHGEYSMARYLVTRGLVVVTIDSIAVGESDQPIDGFLLTPSIVADVNAAVVDEVGRRLRAGTVAPSVAPLDEFVSIGVGHSAGALLTVYQQARHSTHDALALLGFGGGGLMERLTDEERVFAHRPDELRPVLASLAQARFGRPLPVGSTSMSPFLLRSTPSEAVALVLGEARSAMLALVGLASMVPGASTAELAAIRVPVLLAVGEFDITGDRSAIPGQLPNSPDVTLFVLPESGHNHNAEPTRTQLWDELARWSGARR
jgi:pimeloyl-ACP methyl ester carboxylesterase